MSEMEIPSFIQRLGQMGIMLHEQHKPTYKYTDVNTAIKILENNKVRFRTPSTFNDPLEFSSECFDFSFTRQEIEEKLHKDLKLRKEYEDYNKRKEFINSKSSKEIANAYLHTILKQ